MTETTPVRTQTANDLAWWIARLRQRYPEAGPPLFRRRSNVYRRGSKRIVQPLPAPLAARLARSDQEFTHEVFLAAIVGVLYRYAGDDEVDAVVVGAPPLADAEPKVLPLVVRISGESSFAELRAAAAASIAESNAHPDYAPAALLDELGMGEVVNRHPLFPVVLRVNERWPIDSALRHDVTLSMLGTDTIELEYNASVHDEATVARFGQHIAEFLAAGLAAPATSVREVDYLSIDERALLLETWSGGAVAPPEDTHLQQLVEAAVAAHPDLDALVFGDTTISYRELDVRVNQLANHLRGRGARVGSRVGLCLPASAELLIGVLAVVKSGATVVPIVHTFPASRNKMTIEDSAMSLVITNTALLHLVADVVPEAVCIDRDAELIAKADPAQPRSGATKDDLLYLLFTSGSTGRPKGVAMATKTLVNLIRWQRDRGPDPLGKRTLQRSSIGFDISFQEIFATLAYGGTLVVAPDEVRDDVSLLPEFIERNQIARIFLPPVALDQMAVTANLTQQPLTTLKEVIVAGEQLQISMPIRRLFHQMECRLDNQYGPTETHVATAYALTGPSTRWAGAPPIGKPVRNVRIYLLDQQWQPVPAGVVGEMFVGGIGPAIGYLTEQQTAERFHPDPFLPGGVVYQTGDRARFLADGNIEFLGRRDGQVKIRGYRIELGDIEAHLLRLPGIHQAAAAVHESDTLGKQLAAYVVAEGETDPARIRQALLEDLPGHMVPATHSIMALEVLPKTPTGKVDRRALKPPPRAAASTRTEAKGSTEQIVAELWATALELPRVGRHDGFIELGGHSLIGIQVVTQINEIFSIALPLRSLLRGTTVAALAVEIDRLRGVSAPAELAATESSPAAVTTLRELELPEGRRIVCLQPAETRYLYLDVFEHHTYHGGGIRYPQRGVILDVGAHLGLFTLYALDQSPSAEVYAFEPCPPLFDALTRNTENLPGVKRFPIGLSDREGTAELTFYPNLTGMTSFHPNQGEERALLRGILRNLSELPSSLGSALLANSAEYLDEQLLETTYRCTRRTLSSVLAEHRIDRVELLKIDVQKAELEVLRGIEAAQWPRIQQLAIELHDLGGALTAARSLLADRGYRVTVAQDPLHSGTAVHFLYAVRE